VHIRSSLSSRHCVGRNDEKPRVRLSRASSRSGAWSFRCTRLDASCVIASVMSDYDHAAVTRAERRRCAGPSHSERAYWPKFTLAEVAKHVSLKDGWVVIFDRVFDITTFAITHPGFHNAGQVSTALAITRNLGKDCTDEFVSVHSPTAWHQLHDFQIGVLLRADDDLPLSEIDVVPPVMPTREHAFDPHPVPRRNHRPTPTWLTKDRSFWSRYGAGVDDAVLRYLEKQGYKQMRGGVEFLENESAETTERTETEPESSIPEVTVSLDETRNQRGLKRSPSGRFLGVAALAAGVLQAAKSFSDFSKMS